MPLTPRITAKVDRHPAGVSDGWSLKLLAFSLALIPTVSGTRRGLIFPGLRMSELLAVIILAVLLIALHRRFRVGGAAFWALLAYATVTAVVVASHWFNSSDLSAKDFVGYGLGPIVLLLTYVISYAAGASYKRLLLNVCRYLFILASGMAVLGFLQVAGVSGARQLASALTGNQTIVDMPNWKVPRAIGVFHSWHAYASYMALSLIVAIAILASGAQLFRRGFVLPLCVLLMSVGLVSSLTFGMVALGLAGAAYFLARKGKWLIAVVGALLIYLVTQSAAISSILAERISRQEAVTTEYGFLPQTIAFRVVVWTREYFPLISENLLIGYGPVRASDRVFEHVESMYILVLVISGFFGAVAFSLFVACLTGSLIRRSRGIAVSDVIPKSTAHAVLLFLLGLVILMTIHPYINDAGSSELLVILAGILIGSQHLCSLPESSEGNRGVGDSILRNSTVEAGT